MSDREKILSSVRQNLGRKPGQSPAPRPGVLPPRAELSLDEEIDLLLKEINALSGSARRINRGDISNALKELVSQESIQKAVLWRSSTIAQLQIETLLRQLGVEIVAPEVDKHRMAECDLGITEVDYTLPETGTLGLLSSSEHPRPVSLLPRVHLAIIRPQALCPDLHQVFADAKQQSYLIFITGPSRTADIELTTTLGVHGPKALYAWVLEE